MVYRANKIGGVQGEYRYLIILLIGFIFYNSFFLNKALHIDDPFTIAIARAINKDFLNVPKVFSSNPILLGYYYAPIIRLFSEREIWLHIFYLPFSLLVIISMFLLSLRFTREGLLPTLSLIVSPALLIMSHSIMLDIPALSFFLTAITAFIYGTDRNDKRLLFLSGILAGIAILIKYSGLLLIPLMFVYALLFSKKRSYLFLLIPISIFFIWGFHNVIFYKKFYFIQVLLGRLRIWSIGILIRSLACLSFINGTTIIGLFLIPFLLRNRNNIFLLFTSLPVSLCPFLMKETFAKYFYLEKLCLALLFVSSLFIILVIFKAGSLSLFKKPYDKDRLFLSLWFFITLIYIIFIKFIAARFILFLLPPMFLFLYSECITLRVSFLPGFKKMILFSILVTLLISTILAIGDYHFAGIYRDFVSSLNKKLPLVKKTYFSPLSYSSYYSWGYAYYLNRYYPKITEQETEKDLNKMQDVFLVLPSEPVLPMVSKNIYTPNEFHNLNLDKILINEFDYKSNIFLHNRKHRTGFYCHDWGLLPFKLFLQKSTLEKFCIYKLVSIK